MPSEARPHTPALAAGVRQIKAVPFCWQHKPALRKIREAFDRAKTVSSALGTYNALTEIASDEAKEEFQTTHAYIAQKSGWSPRTVQDRLAELVEIGLVEISTPMLKSPSTYRLLPVPQPLPSDWQPSPDVRQQTEKGLLPSLEQLEQGEKKELTAFSTKSKKLTKPQKELADRFEVALGEQWVNDAGKWVNRIKTEHSKCGRVIDEVENAIKENRIKTTTAQYAEQQWKEFK
jgi:hypothetical protein